MPFSLHFDRNSSNRLRRGATPSVDQFTRMTIVNSERHAERKGGINGEVLSANARLKVGFEGS